MKFAPTKPVGALWNLWQTTAARRATRIAVIDTGTGREWSFGELTLLAERMAATVSQQDAYMAAPHKDGPRRDTHAAGIPPYKDGRIIPICQPNSAVWLAAFLGVQKIRAAVLPLDPALAPEAQQTTIRQLNARSTRKVCCIKLTSGTTGELKPILCSASNLIADGEQIIRTMGIRPADRNLAVIPLGHSYGLGNLVMPLLLQGTSVACTQTFIPREILDLIEKYNVTVFPAVPAVLQALARLEGVTKPASLRLVISAGAPLSAELAQQFHRRYGIMVHNFYGSSETGGISYDRTGRATLSGRSVGKPVQGVAVRLRRDGRVFVSSRAGTATLPDLGERNRYGELRLLGRRGELANIGGRKVSPAEVERSLRALRGVSDAWVAVVKDKRGDDCLAAAVETLRGRVEIETELLRALPPWKLPRTWLIDATLPRTDRGKLHTAEIRTRLSVMT